MTKLEEYTSKAEASLAAAEAATSERDRAFHRRAHTIWRKLIRGIGEAEERAAMQPGYGKRPAIKRLTSAKA
ncbi:hypothetical protein EO081_06015 [Sphingomonas desiccabilis]|uniref:Uncharacterized protein n=1 Tax=Sphingomonas desiccabilis TaxID=429134 RepID=A0A4Q2IWR0_9SPHN|nr:hypothetical protein [Sphingomonas desiccabilis]RXZ35189.1 hypothetical protein EO081_06015 [Sphingomonas desiccabilis]